jgi:hypothetical protein
VAQAVATLTTVALRTDQVLLHCVREFLLTVTSRVLTNEGVCLCSIVVLSTSCTRAILSDHPSGLLTHDLTTRRMQLCGATRFDSWSRCHNRLPFIGSYSAVSLVISWSAHAIIDRRLERFHLIRQLYECMTEVLVCTIIVFEHSDFASPSHYAKSVPRAGSTTITLALSATA